MRPLEAVLAGLAGSAYLVVLFVSPNSASWRLGIVGGLAAVTIWQLGLQGHRWQLWPMYVFVAALMLILAMQASRSGHPLWQSRLAFYGAGVGLGVLGALAVLLLALFPVFDLPRPTGSYAVGLRELHLIDESRPERLSPEPGDHRELMVKVWYPAEPVPDGEPVRYWEQPDIQAPHLARAISVPDFLFTHLGLVRTHSYRDAPLSAKRPTYPVLLFSHGMSAFVEQSTYQMEELASHGYIVMSISHPYDTSVVLFPAGRLVALDRERLQAWNDEVLPFVTFALENHGTLDAYLEEKPEEAEAKFREIIRAPLKISSISLWVEDIRFVLNELDRLNGGDSFLTAHLDLERVGAFGHSFGGAASAHAAWKDPRIKAVVNLDGTQYSELGFSSLEQPLMMIHGSQFGKSPGVKMWDLARNRFYRVTVADAYHLDFSDLARVSRLMRLFGLFGPIEPARVHAIANRYTLAFFDRHLRNRDAPLLDGPTASYADVEFEIKN